MQTFEVRSASDHSVWSMVVTRNLSIFIGCIIPAVDKICSGFNVFYSVQSRRGSFIREHSSLALCTFYQSCRYLHDILGKNEEYLDGGFVRFLGYLWSWKIDSPLLSSPLAQHPAGFISLLLFDFLVSHPWIPRWYREDRGEPGISEDRLASHSQRYQSKSQTFSQTLASKTLATTYSNASDIEKSLWICVFFSCSCSIFSQLLQYNQVLRIKKKKKIFHRFSNNFWAQQSSRSTRYPSQRLSVAYWIRLSTRLERYYIRYKRKYDVPAQLPSS